MVSEAKIPAASKARCVIVTLSPNARGGYENSAASEILCCKNNAAFEKVT
jgi:hypothetical protein